MAEQKVLTELERKLIEKILTDPEAYRLAKAFVAECQKESEVAGWER